MMDRPRTILAVVPPAERVTTPILRPAQILPQPAAVSASGL